MNKTEIETKYSKHQLTIISMDDFSDEIHFSYFKPKAGEVVEAELVVNLRKETPEMKLAEFFASVEALRYVKNYSKEIDQLKDDPKAQAKAISLYTNIMKMRELCPELEIDDYEFITDEEVQFFEEFKASDIEFKRLRVGFKHENRKLNILVGERA